MNDDLFDEMFYKATMNQGVGGGLDWDGLNQRIEELEDENERLAAELKVTDELLVQRERLLDAIPECPAHGKCIPHALEWIEGREAESDKLQKLRTWINAYPVSIFPEPDLEKAARVLKENDMTLDSISASNFRFILGRMLETLDS